MNKVIHVPAYFYPIGKNVTKKVATGETKKGFFGGDKPVKVDKTEWVKTGYSDTEINSERLAEDIEKATTGLNQDGYRVVSVTPVISGAYDRAYKCGPEGDGGYGYGYGYGYSYTNSVIIIAEKKGD